MTTNLNDSLLEQKLKGNVYTFIIEDEFLNYRCTGRTNREEKIALHLFSPEYVYFRKPDNSKLAVVLFCSIVIILLINIIATKHSSAKPGSIIVLVMFSIVLFTVSLPSLIEYLISRAGGFHFYNRYNGQLIMSFIENKPNIDTVKRFILNFQKKIKLITENYDHKLAPSITAEIERLNELKEKKILTQEEFDKAKQDLLNQLKEKKIGF